MQFTFLEPIKKSDHFNEDSWHDEEPPVTPGFNQTTFYGKSLTNSYSVCFKCDSICKTVKLSCAIRFLRPWALLVINKAKKVLKDLMPSF
jgi:hypothetical protein